MAAKDFSPFESNGNPFDRLKSETRFGNRGFAFGPARQALGASPTKKTRRGKRGRRKKS